MRRFVASMVMNRIGCRCNHKTFVITAIALKRINSLSIIYKQTQIDITFRCSDREFFCFTFSFPRREYSCTRYWIYGLHMQTCIFKDKFDTWILLRVCNYFPLSSSMHVPMHNTINNHHPVIYETQELTVFQ